MRVIAGKARSLRLKTPEGLGTRPTTDRIKETLFNMLQTYVPGAVFVDLFAGSGGIGIEALSRGASYAYFVENDKEAVKCIQDNLNFTKFSDSATLLKQDVFTALPMIREKEVDIIFMDPPYEAGYERQLLALLNSQSYVTEDTLMILEAEIDKELDFLEDMGLEIMKEKLYKTNKHIFIQKKGRN